MKKIKEIIIVEGKNDFNYLKSFLDAEIVKTEGTSLPGSLIELLLTYKQENKDFIILTDPDAPGEQIRRSLSLIIPNAKHAFLDASKSKYKNKIGVEHASRQEILRALEHLVSFEEIKDSNLLKYSQFYDLGLIGKKDSAYLRNKLATHIRIGRGTAKTIFKRLNMLGYTYEKLEGLVKEVKLL